MTSYSKVVTDLRKVFETGKTRTKKWRENQLLSLLRLMENETEEIAEVLRKDLTKPYMEAVVMECDTIKIEIAEALDKLEEWMSKKKVERNLLTFLDNAFIQPEPLGVVLIIGAWNYPFQLTLTPLIGAIAAGNCVVLKPSELSSNSALFLGKKIPEYLDSECIKVINGGIPETTSLLTNRFDHIFYTGSTSVGKIIYKAAAEYLTPVTLELGGKSPTIIDDTSDLTIVAKRLMWGKLCNCGQTCISPDYVLCTNNILNFLIQECKLTVYDFHHGDSKRTPHFGRIINRHHFLRLRHLLDRSDGTIAYGGTVDEEGLYVSPTLLIDVKDNDPVMEEEIFGPILPFVVVEDMDEAIRFINKRPKPLIIYLFTKNSKLITKVTEETQSGSLVVNDVLINMTLPSLPFGGLGNSGIGAYHGYYSFQTFTHFKSNLVKKQNMEFISDFRYPPYSDKKMKVVRWALKRTPNCQRNPIVNVLPYIGLAVLLAIFFKLIHWAFF